MLQTARSIKYLFTAPFILALLVAINWIVTPGDWWVKWAAFGMGIAWVIALFRVMRTVILVGGLAALGAWLAQRMKSDGAGTAAGMQPPPRDI